MAEPHGYPVGRLPKCTTEYAVRYQHEGFIGHPVIVECVDLHTACAKRDQLDDVEFPRRQPVIVARIVTEWVEIDAEVDG